MDRLEYFQTLLPQMVGSKEGPVSPPIVSTASFAYGDADTAEAIFSGELMKPVYSRMGNPTNGKLETILAKIDGGQSALAVSSGMAAITVAVLGICAGGDEVIAVGGLFGGTYSFFSETLSRYGVKTHFFDVDDKAGIAGAINGNTRALFCESVGNPNMRLPDLDWFGELAAEHKLCYIIDNTITPIVVEPLKHGADMVVYSTTKIISGSAQALGGAVVFRAVVDDDKFYDDKFAFLHKFITKAGKNALLMNAKKRVLRDFGMSASAFNSYLTLLGLETLPLRLRRVYENVETIAEGLYKNGFDVSHPSRSHHEHHDLYKRQYPYGCGNLMTVNLGSKRNAFDFINALKLSTITANIGDSRTLAIHAQSTIYCDFNEAEMRHLGISEGLIRLSIGLENPNDILEDFYQAKATI